MISESRSSRVRVPSPAALLVCTSNPPATEHPQLRSRWKRVESERVSKIRAGKYSRVSGKLTAQSHRVTSRRRNEKEPTTASAADVNPVVACTAELTVSPAILAGEEVGDVASVAEEVGCVHQTVDDADPDESDALVTDPNWPFELLVEKPQGSVDELLDPDDEEDGREEEEESWVDDDHGSNEELESCDDEVAVGEEEGGTPHEP